MSRFQLANGASIELEGGYRGIVTHTRRTPFTHDPDAPVWPIFAMPWQARYELEQTLAVILAGPAAERIYAPAEQESGYIAPAADEVQVREAVERLEVFATEERQQFADTATDPAGSDLSRSLHLASLCSSGAAHARDYMAWFEREIEGWVCSPQFRYPLVRVVEALLERGELTGAEVEALVHNTKETLHAA